MQARFLIGFCASVIWSEVKKTQLTTVAQNSIVCQGHQSKRRIFCGIYSVHITRWDNWQTNWFCRFMTSRRLLTLPVCPRCRYSSANKIRFTPVFDDPTKIWSFYGSKNAHAGALGGSDCVRSQDATHSVWGGGLQRGEWIYVRTSSTHVYCTTSTQWYGVWDHQFTQSRVWSVSCKVSFR